QRLYVRSVEIRERLADELPWQPDYRRDLVAALNNRGLQLLAEARYDEGDKVYDRAVRMIRELLGKHPGTPSYDVEQSHCLYQQGLLRQVQGKPDAARALVEEALKT